MKFINLRLLPLIALWSLVNIAPASAGLVFVSEEENLSGTPENIFTLNTDDTTGDVELRFGQILTHALKWNSTDNRFELSEKLRIKGDLEQEGNTLTLDAENIVAGADVDIVANQGSDNPGTIRYNSTDNRWEISNDGGNFEAIRSGVLSANVLTFDRTLADKESTLISHNTDTSNGRVVQIKNLITNVASVDDTLDFDLADAALFIQENSTTGTNFIGGAVRLKATFAGGSGTTDVSFAHTSSASSSTDAPSNANDGNNETFWYTAVNGAQGGFWQIDLDDDVVPVNKAEIRWFDAVGTYNCTTFEIQGSNINGGAYTTVYTGNTVNDPIESTYTFPASTYQYWRFLCTAWLIDPIYYVLREVRLFEATATFSANTPSYVTTGTNALDTSDWTQLTSLDIGATQPAGTSIKHLVSFDNKTTWKYWNGTAWTDSSLDNLQTDGMTEAEIEAITSTQWFFTGGINSGATRTLDFAFDLSTTDTAATPRLNNVSVTFIMPDHWKLNTENYDIQEFNTTQTQVTNRTGSTQTIKVNIILP